LNRDRLGAFDRLPFVDAPRPPQVALDERIDARGGSLSYKDARSLLRNLRHEKLEGGRCFRVVFEKLVDPGEYHGADRLHFQVTSANQVGQVTRRTRNCVNGTTFHEPRRAACSRDGKKLDPSEPGKSKDSLGHCDGSLGVRCHDHELNSAQNGVHALQRSRHESGHGAHRLRQYVNHVLAAARRGLSLFRFQDCVLQSARWRSFGRADTVIIRASSDAHRRDGSIAVSIGRRPRGRAISRF